ncbi:MAG: hypothetical protein H0T77_05320 [Pyrinomonadaceae bacterium]|nr:hypothetical protein [Pyrinomonadaceae bacterium]
MKTIAGSVSICVIALALAVEGRSAKKAKPAITADQVIASIRIAIAAKPGNLLGIEVEKEGEKTVCEIEILTADSRTYEVEVDVASNEIVEVELKADDDEDEDGKDAKTEEDKKP